jgi:hypothetical protein
VTAVLAVACTDGPGVRPDRIAVGDCYDDPRSEEVDRFDVVPCDEAHENEVFHLFQAEGGDYPGQEALLDIAAVRCRGEAFTDYVGVQLEESDLRVFQVLPTARSWRRGDREVVCVLYAGGGRPIVGSARAAT